MPFHFTVWHLPLVNHSRASVCSAFLASVVVALLCGPLCIAALICDGVHGLPQSNGQPDNAYWRSSAAAG